jgi:hypothetical protein
MIAAAGCGGVTHGSAPVRSQSPSTIGAASPSATPVAKVPNPFTILARWSAASLGLHHLLDLAIGPDGNLYVADAEPSVTVISPEGKVLRKWGKKGTKPGDLSFVSFNSDPTDIRGSIAVGPDGKVYISDSGNHRVDVFSSTGAFIRQFGDWCRGNVCGQFLAPWNLAVDRQGDVYVADDTLQTLWMFSPAGRFQWSIAGNTATDPDLRGHFLLETVDSHGRVVVGVDDAHRIVYIDARGRKVDAFGINGLFLNDWGPCDVTVNGEGYTVVQSCPDAGQPVPGVGPYRATLLFDRNHRLVGAWYGSPFILIPRFGPHGEAFALGDDGKILKVKVALPGA